MTTENYRLIGPAFANSFALHEHTDRGIKHQHDGGVLVHDHEDGSHLLDPMYERP